MSENNLAIIFSPVLGTSSDVIVHFILDYEEIFPLSDRPKLPSEWPNVNFSKVEVIPISQVNTKTAPNHSVPPRTNHVPMPSSKARPQSTMGGGALSNSGTNSYGQSASLSSSAPLPSSVPPKTNHVPMPVQKKYSSSRISVSPAKPPLSAPPKTNHVPMPVSKTSSLPGSGFNVNRTSMSSGHLTVNHSPTLVSKTYSTSCFTVSQKSQPKTPMKLPPPPSPSSSSSSSQSPPNSSGQMQVNAKRPQMGATTQSFQPPQKPLPQQKKALPTPPPPKGQGNQQQIRPVTGTQTLRRPLPQKKESF